MAIVVPHHHHRRFLSIVFFLVVVILPPSLSQPPHTSALLQFKKSLSTPDSLYNWKDDGSNPCDPSNVWVGVFCANGLITSINLAGMGLQGAPDVAALQIIEGLKAISIENNSFAGPIPQINRIRYLRAFYAGFNQFSGVIPYDFFQTLGTLKKLWLSHNKFSGEIPSSLGDLPNLKELHLDYNEFSGPIPPFPEADVMLSLDLSNNKLEGRIPESMNKFDAKVFANNTDLCGSKLDIECKSPQQEPDSKTETKSKSSIIWILIAIVVALLILIILVKVNQKDEEEDTMRPLDKPKVEEAVVNIPPPTKKSTSSGSEGFNNIVFNENNNNNNSSSSSNISNNNDINNNSNNNNDSSISNKNINMSSSISTSTGTSTSTTTSTNNNNLKDSSTRDSSTGSSRKGSSVSLQQVPPSGSDMVMVNKERGVFGLQDLMKSAAEVLGNGGLGSAYKATLGTGVSVVVKRVREMNQMTKEVFDTEMKKLANLKHKNILTPLAYHFRKEEKLLVSEYVSKGSLLYVLHGDRGISHAELNWPTRLKIIKGVARGMGFLHSEFASYELPHGNLKSSNVLIGSDFEPLLSDYALHPLINTTPTAQCMFAYKSPEATLNQKICQKSDVYCLGIVILEIITGKYPSQYFNNQKGGTDVVQWVRSALAEKRERELIDPAISSNAKESIRQMEKLLVIGSACTESESDERIDMKEAIRRIEEISV